MRVITIRDGRDVQTMHLTDGDTLYVSVPGAAARGEEALKLLLADKDRTITYLHTRLAELAELRGRLRNLPTIGAVRAEIDRSFDDDEDASR